MAKILRRTFFWLSGAGTDSLEACPKWEQRKYVAFGATVLVPSAFAFIACAYALSTLTPNWHITIPVAIVWALIILTIDRALLATYRPYQGWTRKLGQFSLRFVVALLMGLTISHPLTLLLFRDTVRAEIEKNRQVDIDALRAESAEQKAVLDGKLAGLEQAIAADREKLNATYSASFLEGEKGAIMVESADGTMSSANPEEDARVAAVKAPFEEKIAAIDAELAALQPQFQTVQTDLDFWQREYERELNGQRSGLVGVGPRARSIAADQIAWRRAEATRLGGLIGELTGSRSRWQEEMAAAERTARGLAEAEATEQAARELEEKERLAALKRDIQAQQAVTFVEQQKQVRESIGRQIEAKLDAVTQVQGEIALLTTDTASRIAQMRAEPRYDILSQTLALHEIFRRGEQGGGFAMAAYLVLTALFMLVDTIPLVVKFFCKAGPYDTLLDCDEVRYEKAHGAFLENHEKYVNQLSAGRLMSLTQHKPLEQSLIMGIERSRAAKEFLESLMELERAFQERGLVERQKGTNRSAPSAAMLEHMAEAFYTDMRARMEQFFQDGEPRKALS